MPSIITPLQLTASASLLANTGFKGFPAGLQTSIDAFNATTLISNYISAVTTYKARSFANASTLTSVLSIGNSVCPGLGNSIPASPLGTYSYLSSEYLVNYLGAFKPNFSPSGFSNLIEQTCAAYLGNGDYGQLTQGFMSAQGFTSTINQFINSSVNANQYLGPTFDGMSALTTAGIANINTDLENFGVDLANQGELWDMSNLDLYGTPAGLIQQISALAGIQNQAIPALQDALISVGLTTTDIKNLVQNNQVRLNNPNGLTLNEFDKLQKVAYSALTMVGSDDLVQILDILDVTTPNITSLEQLLDPTKTFPLSYLTMQTPSPNGPVPIFGANGAVNSSITPIVNSYLPTATGCDELGKIIPPADAVANKAIEVALKQINNIPETSLPKLAETVLGNDDNPWTPDEPYLANDIVSVPSADPKIPEYFQAIADVPEGVDITDTDYWEPTELGGLSTMDGLPLIEAQTTAVDPSVTDYFEENVATGTGPNGTITIYDILGLAMDSNDFASRLDTATAAIEELEEVVTAGDFVIGKNYTILTVGTTDFTLIGAATNTVGESFDATGVGTGDGTASQIGALNDAYLAIQAAGSNSAVITAVNDANAAILALRDAPAGCPQIDTLNTAWIYMANLMNLSCKYTTESGYNYFLTYPGQKISIYGFVQSLPGYGLLTANGEAAEFLENLADTTTLGGQAVIGVMREARNQERLNASGLYNANQIPSNPPLTPVPVIPPVNA